MTAKTNCRRRKNIRRSSNTTIDVRTFRRWSNQSNVSIITRLSKRALRTVGYYVRRLRNRGLPGAVVLCYHAILPDEADRSDIPFESLHVSETHFEQHCRALRQACDPISLHEFLSGIESGGFEKRRPVLVTFDDGHRNLLTVATPILAKYGIPAALFACTKPMMDDEALWPDRIAKAFGEPDAERLKEVPDDERVKSVDMTPKYPFRHEHLRMMNLDQLRTLAESPVWTIGGHTHSHPVLSRCSPEVQAKEIDENFEVIKRITGKAPTAFAYPNGRMGLDYDETTMTLLRERNIRAAFTTENRFVLKESSPLEEPRMLMTDGVDGAELLHRLAVSWKR
jgi:peptidoglycan/xylan/chitin deacetylase (PgdA/CDA1 family)